jgi:hypothetical protein
MHEAIVIGKGMIVPAKRKVVCITLDAGLIAALEADGASPERIEMIEESIEQYGSRVLLVGQ